SNDLDFESETALLHTLRQISLKHTVVVVTHSLRVASLAQHVYHVRGDGQVDHGAPEQMLPLLFGVTANAVAASAAAAGGVAASAVATAASAPAGSAAPAPDAATEPATTQVVV
ncbi:MAG: ABC transporter, partial [Comamonas sp.]